MRKYLLLLALTLAPGFSAVVYDFTGTGAELGPNHPALSVSFRLVVPAFIDPPLDAPIDQLFESFQCTDLSWQTNCLHGVNFSNQGVLGAYSAQLGFQAVNFASYAFFFPTGAFRTPGVHHSSIFGPYANIGVLTVTVSDVPEPAPGALVFGALLVLTRLRLRRGRPS